MSFLRIGTNCVVIDDDGRVLLSQRGDLNTWNLPGGRLDQNEYLWDAAAREVHEETGIEVKVIRLGGLYYAERWNRMNAVFLARPRGGTLKQKTYETRQNAWFAPDQPPESMFDRQHILDALGNDVYLRTISTPLATYRKLRRKFALRWIENLLRGHPEPRYPRFRTVAIVLSDEGVLNHIVCDGTAAPWRHVSPGREADIDLVGVHHMPQAAEIRLIFQYKYSLDQANFDVSIEDMAKTNYSHYLSHMKNPESVWLMDGDGSIV